MAAKPASQARTVRPRALKGAAPVPISPADFSRRARIAATSDINFSIPGSRPRPPSRSEIAARSAARERRASAASRERSAARTASSPRASPAVITPRPLTAAAATTKELYCASAAP